jgi:hypothetical protein
LKDYPGAVRTPVQSAAVSTTNLYFAYTSLLAPGRLAEVAPGAEFEFTAHYSSTRLKFVSDGELTIPTLEESGDHTVWGAVFSVPFVEMDSITRAEKEAGRMPGWEMRAIDRGGNKHDCIAFVGPEGWSEVTPERSYVDQIVKGARHWNLPAGWIVGLEDLLEDPLFN